MSNQLIHRAILRVALSSLATATMLFFVPPAEAQNPQLQERLTEIKQASAANKQALARYTWQEQQTISLKGEVKKTQLYQVNIGPSGQQQKTELDSSPAPQPSGRRLKQHIVEKKTEEYQQYGQQIAALAKQYTQPDLQKLQQAYQQGNVSLQSGGGEGEVTLVIKNYIKPNDAVTLVYNRQEKAVQSIQVNTYLSDPSDAVTISAQHAKLPDGTNHVAATQINGVSKQLTIATQNSNYHPV
jgi:hypothetical protein